MLLSLAVLSRTEAEQSMPSLLTLCELRMVYDASYLFRRLLLSSFHPPFFSLPRDLFVDANIWLFFFFFV